MCIDNVGGRCRCAYGTLLYILIMCCYNENGCVAVVIGMHSWVNIMQIHTAYITVPK